ncbi:hypothetical protein [Stackebrandtia nassauensis]|uniref:Uncharacterized protein n=1 Tax=Stackebrandtia nassauensis (strain DSM 44728 / CIP 108903 / NRRL B-16338 / NBRC 102104 / LLR-40K-21) TaxID=446470 RepID=D3PY90_STANL|nr:hypothetical protein [Stackebrandtia nassauensis]ADD41457.1 hypothetical protein Snas_1759 [Stackebrandtia nassauensis DSM 44728]
MDYTDEVEDYEPEDTLEGSTEDELLAEDEDVLADDEGEPGA